MSALRFVQHTSLFYEVAIMNLVDLHPTNGMKRCLWKYSYFKRDSENSYLKCYVAKNILKLCAMLKVGSVGKRRDRRVSPHRHTKATRFSLLILIDRINLVSRSRRLFFFCPLTAEMFSR